MNALSWVSTTDDRHEHASSVRSPATQERRLARAVVRMGAENSTANSGRSSGEAVAITVENSVQADKGSIQTGGGGRRVTLSAAGEQP